MANIMQMFRVKNKVTRDSYDLSKKLAFTAKAGELLPVYSRYLMPGDVFDIENKWKTRTAPINTAAFTRFREYYDWYFVPINLLWNKYHTWMTNMKDNNQVATSIKGTNNLTDKHPYFTFNQIRTHLTGMRDALAQGSDGVIARQALNQFGFQRFKLSQKLLHLLGYGDFYDLDAAPIYNLEMSPWRLLAYQKIYQDWYRNSQWEVSSPQTCNIDYITGVSSDLQIPLGELQVQDDTMFDLRYANWNKDLFTGVLPNSQYGDAASINLGGTQNVTFGATSSTGSFTLLSGAPTIGQHVVTTNNVNISGSDASTQLGVTDPNAGNNVYFYLTSSSVKTIRDAMGLTSTGNINSAFTILALRQAEALQKLKEISESNSKDFPSQVDAHYGVRPNNAYSQRSMRIGGYDGTIEIQDIDNTNITENEDGSINGAAIAGKGLSFGSGRNKKFRTEVPGILMCIYHCVPLLDYALGGVNMENMRTLYTDYPIPEFDRTGMTQVPLAAFSNKIADFGDYANNGYSPGSGLIGYAPNYIDSKTDIDEVRGAFYNGGLQSWVAPMTSSILRNYIQYNWQGGLASGVFRGIDWKFFKVNPTMLNPIFAVDADSNVDTDEFWINSYFQVHAIRPLDAQGLPY